MSDRSPARIACLLGSAALALAAVLLAACGSGQHDATADTSSSTAHDSRKLPGTGKPLVTIGDKNYTEQFLLGELYAQALTAQGFSVQLNRDIGPTEVTLPAISSGRLDMYPEYLSTWDSSVAGIKRRFHSVDAALLAGRRYAAR